MRIIIATAARSDLAAIGDYVAVDNPARAATFVSELVDRCEDLATMAERFQLLPPFAANGIRRRHYKDYLILYRIDADTVHVPSRCAWRAGLGASEVWKQRFAEMKRTTG